MSSFWCKEALLVCLVLFAVQNARAFTETKVIASDGADGDRFGYSVSVAGDVAIVGSPADEAGSGSAFILSRNEGGADSWGEVKKLTASDGAIGDVFGFSVSVSGDVALIGAPDDDDSGSSSGSAYVFNRSEGGTDNWGEVKKLIASDGADGDRFGYSVSVSGDVAIVGSPADEAGLGSAYIFSRNEGGADSWGEVKKLTASDGVTGDVFGVSVSVSGHVALIGSRDDDSSRGSAYIFNRNEGGADNWGEAKKLVASDGATGDDFGVSVSVSGDVAIVGATGDEGSIGSAYIFSRNEGGADNWGEVKKLTATDGVTGDGFGVSVSVSRDAAIVGAVGDGAGSGSAYIFNRNEGGVDNWGKAKKLTAADGVSGDNFGGSVSVSGDAAVVGARDDDDSGSSSGSAYMVWDPFSIPFLSLEERDLVLESQFSVLNATVESQAGTIASQASTISSLESALASLENALAALSEKIKTECLEEPEGRLLQNAADPCFPVAKGPSDLSVGVIAGVAGGLALLVAVAAVVFFRLRSRARTFHLGEVKQDGP